MISFDLKCSHGHVFEAWFRSSGDYEDQKAQGFLSCPHCGDTAITKAIMAPAVGRKSNQAAPQRPKQVAELGPAPAKAIAAPVKADPSDTTPAAPKVPDALRAEVMKYMTALKQHVVETCDDVGSDFPEEARKIHYGEAEERGIYGKATADDVEELLEEGIDLMPLPGEPERSVQ